MAFNIKVLGIASTLARLEVADKSIEKTSNKGLSVATTFVEGEVKTSIAHGTNAPVAWKTGTFANSVTSSVKKNVGKVFTDINYSQFLEYGTSKMPERPHFRNTVNKNKKKIKKFISASIKVI